VCSDERKQTVGSEKKQDQLGPAVNHPLITHVFGQPFFVTGVHE
jgi:hypothetical protein